MKYGTLAMNEPGGFCILQFVFSFQVSKTDQALSRQFYFSLHGTHMQKFVKPCMHGLMDFCFILCF